MTFTEQLLQELADADGRIVKSGSGPDMEKWPSRVAAARRSGRVPETKELYGGWCRGGYEIELVDIPAWRLAVLKPISVPSRLARPHPVVQAIQSETQPLGLTKPVQGRALRLIQALITAAEATGHSTSPGRTGFAPPSHGPTPPAAPSKSSSPRSPKRSLSAARPLNADAKTRSKRHARSASAGKPPWKKPASGTRRRTGIRHFEAQEASWRHATRLTEYVSAVRARVEAMPPGQARTDAEAWISWAATTVERVDPPSSPPRLPDVPESRADDLRPFLGH
ncbi:hypothetical protein ACFZCP_28575 [Streptomyces sp. NPDC007971]|uniref:hypothetical protein n=1 Tax=Streptomyces sp. NPDC007971 TaxID=3364799 RepID=UPI0036EA4566